MFQRIFLFIATLLISIMLSGCMGGGPAPQDHYYRLAQNAASDNKSFVTEYDEIGIPPVITSGLYRERPVIYVEADAPLELKQYHYHHWHDAPAHLIQQHMLLNLQVATPKTHFVNLQPGEQRNVLLQARIIHFERETTTQSTQVHVELEMVLMKNYQQLHKKFYQQSIALNTNTMHETAEAFSVALSKIYQAFLQDISR